jgi:hypothetical protein
MVVGSEEQAKEYKNWTGQQFLLHILSSPPSQSKV